jgi:hypothetical protein
MPDAYRVKQDVSIPRVIGKFGKGEDATYETEGVNYSAGSYVLAENMTPRDQERASNGDLDDLLEAVDLDEANSGPSSRVGEPEYGIFIAEHEAEAHALEQYGHIVVPNDQALEAQAAGAEYARQYQDAVKEHGLDRRPVQEMLAQPREEIPMEMLQGAEHRTGYPFDPGPRGQQGSQAQHQDTDRDDSDTESQDESRSGEVEQRVGEQEREQTQAPRPRPGSNYEDEQPRPQQTENTEGMPVNPQQENS